MTVMRPFWLVRDTDVTGVSGTGVVAEGVEFSSGIVALTWLSAWPTSVVFHDRGMESVEAIHGHNGATRIVFDLPDPSPQAAPAQNEPFGTLADPRYYRCDHCLALNGEACVTFTGKEMVLFHAARRRLAHKIISLDVTDAWK